MPIRSSPYYLNISKNLDSINLSIFYHTQFCTMTQSIQREAFFHIRIILYVYFSVLTTFSQSFPETIYYNRNLVNFVCFVYLNPHKTYILPTLSILETKHIFRFVVTTTHHPLRRKFLTHSALRMCGIIVVINGLQLLFCTSYYYFANI